MNKKIFGKIKGLIIIGIVGVAIYFFVVGPTITFKKNEKMLENAARRYYELNSGELPTGQRVKTLSLQTLYHKSFLEGDIFRPLSKKTCNLSKSWVKVKNVDGEYKYYTYLDCGTITSNVDHDGPEVKLNGDLDITLGVNEKFKDEGIKSVVDKKDGKLNPKDVVVKGDVDTSKVGTYEVKYSIKDSLANETVVIRKVTVVQKLSSTVKTLLGDKKYFDGAPENNYIWISNQLFRIVSIDGKNVKVVSSEDVANVNYSKLDKWLDYYYDNLNDFTKKAIVPTKYCNDQLSDEDIHKIKKCESYTDKKKVYILSAVDINLSGGDDSYLKPSTMSWISNKKDDKQAYLTRNMFIGDAFGKNFLTYDIDENYGVRPVLTLNGDILIKGGVGTSVNPYIFEDFSPARGGSLLNERQVGEYVKVSKKLWRIIDIDSDGAIKVIIVSNVSTLDEVGFSINDSNKIEYNPKSKDSVAYYINNNVSNYIKTDYFVSHEYEVPIYKNKIIYGEETKTKKYKSVFFAPDMYDMFSAQNGFHNNLSYWLRNTSNKEHISGFISNVGVPINMELGRGAVGGIRVEGYLKNTTVVSSGQGTYDKPYIIK